MTQPETLPLAKCPNPECRQEVQMDTSDSGRFYWMACQNCDYAGPRTPTREDALRLHNLIASRSETNPIVE